MKLARELLKEHHIDQTSTRLDISSHLQARTPERRRQFLFRHDALLPLTMDPHSWPLCEEGPDGVPVIVTEVNSPLGYTDEQLSVLEKAEFLGFDVGDGGTSTLSNCGFTFASAEILSQRVKWGEKLNCFHLFDSLEDAEAFCPPSTTPLRRSGSTDTLP